MELYAFHNSRLIKYRFPQGALCCRQEAVLRLRLSGADAAAARCLLRLWADGREQLVSGRTEHENGELYHVFHITAPDLPQLIWYYFIIEVYGEYRTYGARSGEGQLLYTHPPDYQITVYDGSFKTPEWFQKSIVYQIFPDRFNRGSADGRGRTSLDRLDYHERLGRRVFRHYDWNEPVLFRPVDGERHYAPCDYFGGDLRGVREKLPYLASLGVKCIYLNPIFEAASNHRYNTSDYMRVDPALGDEAELEALSSEAAEHGIRLMLDGVFSHTGDDSVYFNKYGNYENIGAYGGSASPYYEWYDFTHFPDKYRCWWGFDTLPEVNENSPSYIEFIESVLEKWSRLGISSWRLDVADELPDSFIERLRGRLKRLDPSGVLLGEVWEDASNKEWAQGLRKYVYGNELDSVMNYPFRDAVCEFFTGGSDAFSLNDVLAGQRERYPEPFYRAAMNLLGGHDTERILSALSGAPGKGVLTREEQAGFTLDAAAVEVGKKRLIAASTLQYAMPQPPCLYYGDEAGATGLFDPFNRGTYPWGREDEALVSHYRLLGRIRNGSAALSCGKAAFCAVNADVFAVFRRSGREAALALVSRSALEQNVTLTAACFVEGPDAESVRFAAEFVNALSGERLALEDGALNLTLGEYGAAVFTGEIADNIK